MSENNGQREPWRFFFNRRGHKGCAKDTERIKKNLCVSLRPLRLNVF